MKKYLWLITLGYLFLVVLSGCTAALPQASDTDASPEQSGTAALDTFDSTPSTSSSPVNDGPLVLISNSETVSKHGPLDLTFTNKGDVTILIGEAYTLDFYQDGWTEIDLSDVSFSAVGIIIEPGEDYNYADVALPAGINLEAGRYRIKFKYADEADRDFIYTVSTEFNLSG
ncbi:MAG: hypothetical protein PHR21_07060 [Oscillospiraceae bacterium]|nr:hypothetical protein [Oscillospiraceae bacterium]MDD4368418.1 hypothetical protein [Oscillospiraceae bacterium]